MLKKSSLTIIILAVSMGFIISSCSSDSNSNNGKAPKVIIGPDPTAKK